MRSEAMPIIRLEVENLKHAIVTHMGCIGSELGDRIAAEVDKAVEQYPWESTVKKVVEQSIYKALERHFTYGRGFKAIEGAIEAALSDVNTPS